MKKDDVAFAATAPLEIVQPHPSDDNVVVRSKRYFLLVALASFRRSQVSSPARNYSVEKASGTEVYWITMRSVTEGSQQGLGMGQLLVRLLNHYRREGALEMAGLGYPDFRSSHFQVLAHIPGKGIRLTELAERAHLSLAAASEFVSELEDLGYLERLEDRRDRRAKLIVPTEKGRKGFKDGRRAMARIERRWAALGGSDRFAQAGELLHELLDKLDDVEQDHAGAG